MHRVIIFAHPSDLTQKIPEYLETENTDYQPNKNENPVNITFWIDDPDH